MVYEADGRGILGQANGWMAAVDGLPDEPAAVEGGLPPGGGQGLGIKPSVARPARWPDARISAVEALWGDGFTMPGGGPETIRLVKPLGLTSSATLMLLGGGLGGPAECIVNSLGAWVASFESNARLRDHAFRRVAQQKLARITVSGWDPGKPGLPPHSANHALSLESLRGAKPMPLLEALASALRPHGQIVMTELVTDKPINEADREFAAWCRLDDRLPELPSAQAVTEGLQRLHFDVRVLEDTSDRHTTQTLGGWREAVRAMANGPRPVAQTAAAFVAEAELWLLRIRLMRRLDVRLMRWHAIAR